MRRIADTKAPNEVSLLQFRHRPRQFGIIPAAMLLAATFLALFSAALHTVALSLEENLQKTSLCTAGTGTSTSTANLEEFQALIQRQEQQLIRLENAVKALTEVLDRLHRPAKEDEKRTDVVESKKAVAQKSESERQGLSEETKSAVKRVRVEKYRPAWADRFQFLAAIKVSAATVTCIAPIPPEEEDGVSRYVIVGDHRGFLYVVLAHGGDAVLEHSTAADSAVTAILAYALSNGTVIVTGHGDGAVLMHRLWEIGAEESGSGGASSGLRMENLRCLSSGGAESVRLLEVHQVGKTRYVLCVGLEGRVRVFVENGALHGSVMPPSRLLAALKQRLLFLTENGVASLDLRTMTVRTGACEGLNGSHAIAYAFDAAERSKGYGVTSEGEIVHVVLMGDITNFECRVRSKRRIELLQVQNQTISLKAIKGYILLGTPDKVLVFNSTSPNYVRSAGPRYLFHSTLEEIAYSFNQDFAAQRQENQALIACNRDRLVVVGLGEGYVAMFRSSLPVYKPEFNTVLWSSPALVFVIFLIGAWHLFGKKREAFSLWGSDDIFNATSSTGGSSSARSAVSNENSGRDIRDRDRDISDLRRGTTRRYASPSRYPSSASQAGFGGSTGALTYRSNTVDLNYR
eukprot:TRINITY_DN8300_c0_g2_i1.p1 TRINITY_DN8300_c0_g2~~TRINITY_DN8300_c0_g2_i1.p1  ORF type:complete len:631 (+),score=3.59 TRINITY_DN8300_c0_g2_i1:182-2074(+)